MNFPNRKIQIPLLIFGIVLFIYLIDLYLIIRTYNLLIIMTLENENENGLTTIQISKETHRLLKERKIIKRESFNSVIKRLIKEIKEE